MDIPSLAGEGAGIHQNLDEEGYPQLDTRATHIPPNNESGRCTVPSADHESGETTRRRVVVLRRPPPPSRPTHSPFFPLPALPPPTPPSSRQMTLAQRNIDLIANRCQKTSSHSPATLLSFSQCRKKRKSKKFRVPGIRLDSKSQTNTKLCINAWKEYFLGVGVLHPRIIDFEPKENGCDSWYKLWCAYTEIIRSCSYYMLWIGRLLLYALRIVQPVVGGKLLFCHYRRIHNNIHQEGDKRSLDIKFSGSPFQGMSIYFARVCCPVCSDVSQLNLTLKYFQSTVQERRLGLGT